MRFLAKILPFVVLLVFVNAATVLPSVGKTSTASNATKWTVQARQSSITWSTTWAGRNVGGSFANFNADIRFDPSNLGASRVIATIPVTAVRSSSREAMENLPLTDWFNSRQFPIARFEASNFRSTGGNNYVASGTLNIKGVNYNLALPFRLIMNGNTATMDATTTLDRINLKIGVDSDSSAEWVARQVQVNIHIVATK
jgi:cytochrome b561